MKKRKKKYLPILHPSKKSFSASTFKVAVARTQGRRHESANIPCQDSVLGFCSEKLASIVLADGAGSATYSSLGAQIVVNTITRTLKENFKRIIRSKEAKAKHKVMGPVIRMLTEVSKRYRTELKQYAATLLFVATDGKKLLIGQLGDGRIGIRNAITGEWRTVLNASKSCRTAQKKACTSVPAACLHRPYPGCRTGFQNMIGRHWNPPSKII